MTVGRVKDAHGLKGELFITIFSGEAAWAKQLKTLRLAPPKGAPSSALPIELPIKAARAHKNGIIVMAHGLSDRNQSEALRGYEFSVPASFFVSRQGEALYLREILGFEVVKKDGEAVGPIVAFSTNGAQDLLVIKGDQGEHEVPFVKEFVVHIDHQARRITMDLPRGLLGDLDDA